MKNAIRLGYIGYGNSARVFHLPFVENNPNFEVVAFCTRTPPPTINSDTSARHPTLDFPAAKHYTNVEEFLADSDIDLVSIVTGHDTHASFAEQALLAGKHVIVEKPFSCGLEEAERAIAASRKSGKILTVFQNRRYDSDMKTLQKLIDDKVFGEIVDAEIHYDIDLPPWMQGMTDPGWKPGDGLCFGIGCHTLDQALHLFGRPSSITAFYRVLRGVRSETEDSFTITLQYADKPLVVHVKTNAVNAMLWPMKYFIRGTEGTFLKFGDDRQEAQLTVDGLGPSDPSFGAEPEEIWGELTTRKKYSDFQIQRGGFWIGKVPSQSSTYAEYYDDVAKAVRGEIAQVVKAETSRDGIRIIELARESAEKGVTLPFDLAD